MILQPRWKLNQGMGYLANGWMMSGTGHFDSGFHTTMRTLGALAKEFNVSGAAIVGLSTGMNGYGGDNRVYGIGRNTYRYPATWKADLRIAKRFDLGQMRQLELMAESFNLFNHQNVTEIETVGYSIEPGTLNGAHAPSEFPYRTQDRPDRIRQAPEYQCDRFLSSAAVSVWGARAVLRAGDFVVSALIAGLLIRQPAKCSALSLLFRPVRSKLPR